MNNRFHLFDVVACLIACRISSNDPPALGTIEAAAAAVTHLQRIIDTKHAVLLKSRDPTDRSCLHGMAQWLFEQAGQPETQYRRKCMQLFSALVPHVTSGSGDEPAKQWVTRFTASAGIEVLVSIIEPHATAALPPPLSDTGEDSWGKVCFRLWLTADGVFFSNYRALAVVLCMCIPEVGLLAIQVA